MTLVRWRPFGDLFSMHNRINRLFEDSFREPHGSDEALSSSYPVTNIYETKDNYVFKLEVPGLNKDDLNIEFNDNILTVKGERKDETKVNRDDYHRFESYCGTFSRSFSVPRDVDTKKIEANLKGGILELQLKKAEEKKAKAIPINVK